MDNTLQSHRGVLLYTVALISSFMFLIPASFLLIQVGCCGCSDPLRNAYVIAICCGVIGPVCRRLDHHAQGFIQPPRTGLENTPLKQIYSP